ncbi:hypothetical protein M8C21_018776 [Ambrosia artemisiifolia]|uniref:WRKY domain-containing protein n=1 Tax=Ambrosia artemisiifolia TaxID=4212 RepID=A0AAD5CWX6_AMBAR|nr:hypothetical protein M8C21_018776 [Ambrosia artemisiifolia]
MADWGLQAVTKPKEHKEDDLFGSIDMKKEYDQALLFCYPHLIDHHGTTGNMEQSVAVTDELDQLYNPFYQVHDIQTVHHHQNQHSDQEIQQEIKKLVGSAPKTSKLTPKLKKRKNQQKRVVVRVTADGLSSDPWAWRKYGQKPIKGSIYPSKIRSKIMKIKYLEIN